MSPTQSLIVSALCCIGISCYIVGPENHYAGNIFGAITMLYLGTLGNLVIIIFTAINSLFQKKSSPPKCHPLLYLVIPPIWTLMLFIYLELAPAAGC